MGLTRRARLLAPMSGDAKAPARRALPSWYSHERAVTVLTLLGVVGFILWQLHPSLLVADTTPTGGDMGAHVWAPAYLRDHLLPSLRLSGWTPDFYAGFPAFHFYMVLPSLAIVVLDLVLPYGVAFKLVAVSGVVALPVALYLFGRLARVPFPGPLLLAVAGLAFLFDRGFSIYGGNIPSTLAGEFAFSISLAFAVLFLGVVVRGLETGRDRWLAAVLLAVTASCHLIPAIFALVGLAVAWVLRRGWARLRWVVTAGVTGIALTAWWTVPFVLRRAYLNDMGWEKITQYAENLFPGRIGESLSRLAGNEPSADLPGDLTWIIALAAVGFGVSVARRRLPGIYIGLVGLVFAVGFVVAPQGRLWNARLLPFWYLCLYLLAALAVAELVRAITVLVAKHPERPPRAPSLVAPVVVLAAVAAFLGMGLRTLPGGDLTDNGSYRWLFFETRDQNYIRDWPEWNFSGYERKASYPEYRALVGTMARLGADADHGCGRAMWEYDRSLDRFGTPMALMLLPYWTDGCIGSMEGVYFEASASTPYHFLNQSELSAAPSRPQRDLRYGPLDVDLGVQHLQLMGVRYYMAFSDSAVAQAAANPDLTEVATSDAWHVYEVANAPLVESVLAEPVVVRGMGKGGRTWLRMAQDWYLDPSRWDVLQAASGPAAWRRINSNDRPRERSVDPVDVSNIREGNATISFDVSETGTPVLVKASYFPNWEAHGADGPWRVAPNFMVVVPTSTHVELRYGRTPVDWLGWLITLAGAAYLVVLVRRPPLVVRRADAEDGDTEDVPTEEHEPKPVPVPVE
jgi:hypothetical protein